jgi:hypothetical protein
MQDPNPLGPTHYTGSYTSKNTMVVIGAWCYQQEEERRYYQVVMLARIVSKVRSVLHWTNAELVEEVYLYSKSNSVSERHSIML